MRAQQGKAVGLGQHPGRHDQAAFGITRDRKRIEAVREVADMGLGMTAEIQLASGVARSSRAKAAATPIWCRTGSRCARHRRHRRLRERRARLDQNSSPSPARRARARARPASSTWPACSKSSPTAITSSTASTSRAWTTTHNSLAPLASLAHSGAELVRRGQVERLPQILQTIGERSRHLETFILGYARFAKLPTPALLNLLKNAHESGSPSQDVELQVRRVQDVVRIDVLDRGTGMNDAVLTNALVPFYSTKRSGTGLGLAREIAEARRPHHAR